MIVYLLACNSIEMAPKDIDGLAHYFWQNVELEAEALGLGSASLYDALNGKTIEDPINGLISKLNQEELELVDKEDEDASKATGVFFGNLVNCSLKDIEPGVYAPNQDVLHPDTYASYDREYTSDKDAYEAGEVDTLTWYTTYEVEGLGANYTANLHGFIRYVDYIDDESTPYGPIVISRGVLDQPAFFSESDERGLFQDYQMEVYFERSPGETVHFYTLWREMVYAGSADFSSETVQKFVLDGMLDWDEDTEERCADL
jgi:hypothetical protein